MFQKLKFALMKVLRLLFLWKRIGLSPALGKKNHPPAA
jgi:hypothetical protein